MEHQINIISCDLEIPYKKNRKANVYQLNFSLLATDPELPYCQHAHRDAGTKYFYGIYSRNFDFFAIVGVETKSFFNLNPHCGTENPTCYYHCCVQAFIKIDVSADPFPIYYRYNNEQEIFTAVEIYYYC